MSNIRQNNFAKNIFSELSIAHGRPIKLYFDKNVQCK